MLETVIVSNKTNLIEYLKTNVADSINTIIKTFSNGYESISYIENYTPSIIIIDVDLDDINGIEIFEKLSAKNNTAFKILYLTKHEDYIKLAAYDAGVDYILTDLISVNVFQKKILQIFNRINNDRNIIRYNSLIIDRSKYQIECLDKTYVLPKKQFLIYALLCRQPGTVFTREEIYEKIWQGQKPKN
ncbi:MAG: hypothetical protein CMD08_01055, partial [Flavobacteriales bacterium]|nr:hypothetical protein [Flavobacteriales bacterium]